MRWILRLICCGRDDGTDEFPTWEQAEAFREAYTRGPGVNEYGYSDEHAHEPGHKRAGIISRQGGEG